MNKELVVVKYGGHAMDDPQLRMVFESDARELFKSGTKLVIIHGGGPQINALLKRLDIRSEFVNGLRITDEAVLEAVEMALCGKVNKALARELQKGGAPAAGISGQDGGLILARQKSPELGRVGEVAKVNPALLECLLEGGFIPVVAPLGIDENGEALNINADIAAGSIAGALKAGFFALISDVPGVLDAEGRLIPHLDRAEIARLAANGTISGGMIPKVEACLNALRGGCRRALILDGRQPGALRRFLREKEPLGTMIELGA